MSRSSHYRACVPALMLCACTALNPAFGASDGGESDSQSGTDSIGSASTTSTTAASGTGRSDGTVASAEDGSSGREPSTVSTSGEETVGAETTDPDIDLPTYACEPGFDIQVDSPVFDVECGRALPGALVVHDLGCMAIEFVGGGLVAIDASACSSGCAGIGLQPLSINVAGIDLAALFGGKKGVSECGYIEVTARVDDDGDCVEEHVSLFHDDGSLVAILGNTNPIDEAVAYPIPNDDGGGPVAVTIETPPHPGVPCGDPAAECDVSGWRDVVFDGVVAAGPEGDPAATMFIGQSTSVFNWGMQIDTDCTPRGRWAVVPEATEWIFD